MREWQREKRKTLSRTFALKIWKTCHKATKHVHQNYWDCALEPVLCNKKSYQNEKPAPCNKEQPPLTTTRESPCRAKKTQHSKNKDMAPVQEGHSDSPFCLSERKKSLMWKCTPAPGGRRTHLSPKIGNVGPGCLEKQTCLGVTDSWTRVWASSKSWWWTGRPGVLRSMGLQTQTTERLNWT